MSADLQPQTVDAFSRYVSLTEARIGKQVADPRNFLYVDQLPESLFPLLACQPLLSLTAIDIAVGCAVFFAGAILLSRLFFWLRLRDRPY